MYCRKIKFNQISSSTVSPSLKCLNLNPPILCNKIHWSLNGLQQLQKKMALLVHILHLVWLLQKEPVTAPIIGATKISHLEDSVGALSLRLTPEEIEFLEEQYVPHRIVGHN
jgi:diketogulonate reductase-like aldo/keto reductase